MLTYLAMNLNVDMANMAPATRTIFREFAYVAQNALQIQLVLRGFGALQGSFDYLCAMSEHTENWEEIRNTKESGVSYY